MSERCFAFCGGGSGGDSYPLLTVARALRERLPGATTLFFRSREGLEKGLFEDLADEVVAVESARLYARNLLRLPGALWRGRGQALEAMRRRRPEALLSVGGFVSAPVVLAARSAGVPVALYEPNAVAGRANRWLSHLADQVWTAGDPARAGFPARVRVEAVGYPVRLHPDPERAAARRAARPEGELTVSICGGSLGARILNQAVADRYGWIGEQEGLRVLHVTGRRDHAQMLERYRAAGSPGNVELRAYEESMDLLYADTDLFLGRAGAGTVHELVAFAVPAVLVPLAIAPGDHQARNAQPLCDAGAARLVREADWSAARFQALVEEALADPGSLAAGRRAYAGLQRPPAQETMAERLVGLAELRAPGEGVESSCA